MVYRLARFVLILENPAARPGSFIFDPDGIAEDEHRVRTPA
jgi:hypothetical protein